MSTQGKSIEVIKELLPLANVEMTLNYPRPVARVTLEPQGESLPFEQSGAQLKFKVASFACHQMVVLHDT